MNHYGGSSPLFYINSAAGNNVGSVDLYPPSAINYGFLYANSASGSQAIQNIPVYYSPNANVYTVETPYVDIFPAGSWVLSNHVGSAELGRFLFVGASPFDSNNYFKKF